jgi:hypothetical protein
VDVEGGDPISSDKSVAKYFVGYQRKPAIAQKMLVLERLALGLEKRYYRFHPLEVSASLW